MQSRFLGNEIVTALKHAPLILQEDWISVNADTAEGFEPVVELHASEAHVRSLTILRGGQPGSSSSGGGGGGDNGRRQIQVCM